MTMIAGGDEKVRNAFRATLRDEPSRPNVAATEELSANDILEVHDLANAIARAEQIIRTPSSRPSDLDIFDALLRPSARTRGDVPPSSRDSRDSRDDHAQERSPLSPHAILSPSAVPLAPGHVASKATLNPGPDPLLTATDDTSGPALPASPAAIRARTADSAPDSEPPRTKRSVREVMEARAARMEARGPYRALDLDAEIRADAAGEDYVLTSGTSTAGVASAAKAEANHGALANGADAEAAPVRTAPAVPPPPPSSASTTAVFLSSLAPRPASSAPALPGSFAVTSTLQMPAAPAKPQIIYVNEDDAYYQPGGRMRAFADGTLETRAADATLLVRLRSRQKSLSLVVASVVGALALVALLGFALRRGPETEAPSTTTTTSGKTPEAVAKPEAPKVEAAPSTPAKAEAPKAEPALAPSLQAKPGQPSGAKGRVPVFDVNSLPSAPAR